MGLEALGVFEIIEKIFSAVIGHLAHLKKTPKQRAARELVKLSDLLDEAHGLLVRLSELIYRCESAETKEGKIYLLFEAGKVLNILGPVCGRFLNWVGSDQRVVSAFKLLLPETQHAIERIADSEAALIGRAIDYPLLVAVEQSREALQAVTHPDPQKLPSMEMLSEAHQKVHDLAAHCVEVQKSIRAFARAQLTVEDFF